VSLIAVRGGVYAAGTVVNTRLHFGAEVWNLFTEGKIYMIIEFLPFGLETGAFVEWFGCKLFRGCSWGNRRNFVFYRSDSNASKVYTLFNKQYKL